MFEQTIVHTSADSSGDHTSGHGGGNSESNNLGPYKQARWCADGTLSGYYYPWLGVDDGTAWKVDDDNCVYADLTVDSVWTASNLVNGDNQAFDCSNCGQPCTSCYWLNGTYTSTSYEDGSVSHTETCSYKTLLCFGCIDFSNTLQCAIHGYICCGPGVAVSHNTDANTSTIAEWIADHSGDDVLTTTRSGGIVGSYPDWNYTSDTTTFDGHSYYFTLAFTGVSIEEIHDCPACPGSCGDCDDRISVDIPGVGSFDLEKSGSCLWTSTGEDDGGGDGEGGKYASISCDGRDWVLSAGGSETQEFEARALIDGPCPPDSIDGYTTVCVLDHGTVMAVNCKWWSEGTTPKNGVCKLGKFGGRPAEYLCLRHCPIYNNMRREHPMPTSPTDAPAQLTVHGAVPKIKKPCNCGRRKKAEG